MRHPAQAPDQPGQDAVLLDRLDHVTTTARLEPARRAQQWTERDLIQADRTDQTRTDRAPGQRHRLDSVGGSWRRLQVRRRRFEIETPGHALRQGDERLADGGEAGALPARQDDQIDAGRQIRFAESECFAHQPLETVAGVGRAGPFCGTARSPVGNGRGRFPRRKPPACRRASSAAGRRRGGSLWGLSVVRAGEKLPSSP